MRIAVLLFMSTAAEIIHEVTTLKDGNIPAEVFEDTTINVLIITDKNLKILSSDIGKLVNLRKLCISHNRLESLPNSLFKLQKLEELDMSHNKLRKLPPVITKLRNLKTLKLCKNRLTSLGKSIKKLDKLEYLDLSKNKIDRVPKGICSVESLKTLKIAHNCITKLPPQILQLHNLIYLNVSENPLRILHINPSSPSNSRTSRASSCQLSHIAYKPNSLQNLSSLDISKNRLKKMPRFISTLPNLKDLDISDNKIRNLAEDIEKCTNLEKLDVQNTEICELPAGITNLCKLRNLNVSYNKLSSLPVDMGKLKGLRVIDISKNKFETFPAEIFDCVELLALRSSDNNHKNIPYAISKLRKMEVVDFSENKLEALPLTFKHLGNLRDLHIYSNGITYLPEEIFSECRKLKNILLFDNFVTSIPYSIVYAKDLERLYIGYNPIQAESDSNGVGISDLINMLGDRVEIDDDQRYLHVSLKRYGGISPTILQVCKELSCTPTHWNLEALSKMKVGKVPRNELSGRQILKLWKIYLAEYGPEAPSNEEIMNGKEAMGDIAEYIKQIYKMPGYKKPKYPMKKEHRKYIKDYLEAVFYEMIYKKKRNEKHFEDAICGHLISIASACILCSDAQRGALSRAYSDLTGMVKPLDSLRAFIEHDIAFAKNEAFDGMPWAEGQNLHLMDTWKHRMWNLLGFRSPLDSMYGIQDREKYNDNRAECLRAFYDKFTPEYYIDRLKIMLTREENPELFLDAVSKLGDDMDIDGDKGTRATIFDFGDSKDNEKRLYAIGLTHAGIEKLLTELGILKRNNSQKITGSRILSERESVESAVVKVELGE